MITALAWHKYMLLDSCDLRAEAVDVVLECGALGVNGRRSSETKYTIWCNRTKDMAVQLSTFDYRSCHIHVELSFLRNRLVGS